MPQGGGVLRSLADTIDAVSLHIQKLRWQTRLTTGLIRPRIHPERFTEVATWKGKVDGAF